MYTKGTADEYITFNYADERPALRADDTDLYDETTVQVHYFYKGKPTTKQESHSQTIESEWFYIISIHYDTRSLSLRRGLTE